MEIGHRIARARIQAGLSQSELADAIGVSRGLVGQWESHKKMPGRENLRKIASGLLVSLESLLTDAPADGVFVRDPDALRLLRAFQRMSATQRKNLLELLGMAGDIRREIEHQAEPAKSKIPVD